MQEWIWYAIIGLALFGFGCLGLLVWYLRKPAEPGLFPPSPALPLESIHLAFKDNCPIQKSTDPSQIIRLKDQSSAWRTRMRNGGEILAKKRVRQVLLLHGTFVGSDPVSVLPALRRFFPDRAESGLRGSRIKRLVDRFARDNGNFLPSYVELLESALEAGISCNLFYWSSGNHHAARLEGALRLIERIAGEKPGRSNDRLLLIGHSHARQVFALFTHLLTESDIGQKIWAIVEEEKLAPSDLRSKAREMAKRSFDFVTLGGPVRYAWAHLPGMRVLHIVNHSGKDTQVMNPWSFWNARGGDFVQQWGMVGSDVLAPSAPERSLNVKLDPIIGTGWSTRLWYQTMIKRQRVGDFGRTLLVDYTSADSGKKDNFLTSVFGHGIYTRFDVMLFHLELICTHLYDMDLQDIERLRGI